MVVSKKLYIFAVDFGLPKRKTFWNPKIKKLSKTENF